MSNKRPMSECLECGGEIAERLQPGESPICDGCLDEAAEIEQAERERRIADEI